jgi:hypothetical protein
MCEDDDPIFSADEMRYDYSDSDTACVLCGCFDTFYDEQREEYICVRCLKRHNAAWMAAQAQREAEFAESIERDIDRYERQRDYRDR